MELAFRRDSRTSSTQFIFKRIEVCVCAFACCTVEVLHLQLCSLNMVQSVNRLSVAELFKLFFSFKYNMNIYIYIYIYIYPSAFQHDRMKACERRRLCSTHC